MVQIVWFKRDLRVMDHKPLVEASMAGPVIPLYVIEPDYWHLPDTSRRQWLAISKALEELDHSLAALGTPLITRLGSVTEVLANIHNQHGITSIHAHEETGNAFTFERDKAVRAFCRDHAIRLVEYQQFGVVRGLKNRDDWTKLHYRHMTAPILDLPNSVQGVSGVDCEPLPTAETLGLKADGCETPQLGTRAEASQLLKSFFAGRGARYRSAMSSPLSGEQACSRLSVPLSTGAISIREVMRRCYNERQQMAKLSSMERAIPLTAIDSLIARLHWHCHFIQKLESEPEMEWRSQHVIHEANRIQTAPDDPRLLAWISGQTGLPFVDACMRSLIATGWLNFRMRAMVQCIASHHLALDWHLSGTRLAQLFTDYEPGIHWSQVQMQSGQAGINIPRIYNPVKQGLDQDPDGIFTRRWVPELSRIPLEFLQEPWKMDTLMQQETGCILGRDYPMPVVDHIEAARSARERLTVIRRSAGYSTEAKRVFQQHGSRKKQSVRRRAAQVTKVATAKPKTKAQLTLDF
jgi:deoxyribodipyrimidine photo-lyase